MKLSSSDNRSWRSAASQRPTASQQSCSQRQSTVPLSQLGMAVMKWASHGNWLALALGRPTNMGAGETGDQFAARATKICSRQQVVVPVFTMLFGVRHSITLAACRI